MALRVANKSKPHRGNRKRSLTRGATKGGLVCWGVVSGGLLCSALVGLGLSGVLPFSRSPIQLAAVIQWFKRQASEVIPSDGGNAQNPQRFNLAPPWHA